MTTTATNINLYDYLDYRLFLKDWYKFSKKSRRGFSFRAFSKRAGNPAPNFLKRVMDGQHNLTPNGIKEMIKGLGLNKQESDFFIVLVHFNQAKTHEEKNKQYQKIIRSACFAKLRPLDKNQYLYFSTWYNPIIRELVVSSAFDGSYEWLANKIRPVITPEQAKKSVALLATMGFIKENSDHTWSQTTALVSTGHEAVDISIANYHLNVLSLIAKLITRIEPEQRQSHTMTLGVTRDKIALLKKKVQEFRNDVLTLVAEDTDPEEVVLVSVHMLPVTQETPEKDKKLSNV
ncbi:MAG: hypothetical protein ACD_62C00315G0002 [uncultured bacterium]|nr:MAG: hypothetical protein ACD_62C00315G0002 [uncultured bacterium]HLD44976.1 TIGR02147 family protein [bacterium]